VSRTTGALGLAEEGCGQLHRPQYVHVANVARPGESGGQRESNVRSIGFRVVLGAVGLLASLALGMIPVSMLEMAAAAATTATAAAPPNCSSLEASYAGAPVETMAQTTAEQTVWCLTNDQRSANGLARLSLNSILGGTARAHAQDAVTRQWWVDGADTHTNPDGQHPVDRILAAHYCDAPKSHQVAENTYWGWGTPLQTPRSAVTWWMNDPPHRATILDSALKDLGVGVVKGAPRPGTYAHAAVFVQDFGTCSK
jgi:uncharacterized protein YkwD